MSDQVINDLDTAISTVVMICDMSDTDLTETAEALIVFMRRLESDRQHYKEQFDLSNINTIRDGRNSAPDGDIMELGPF